jgi:mycothiol synthase
MLKVCSARYAQQHGYRYITTDNEENNPMYRLNLQLGFEPLPAWVYYEKQVR